MATSAISGRSVTGREIHPPLADSSTGPLRRDAARPRCGGYAKVPRPFGSSAAEHRAEHRAERMRQYTRNRRHASSSINGPNRTASRTPTHLYGLRSNRPSRCEILPALRITTAVILGDPRIALTPGIVELYSAPNQKSRVQLGDPRN